MGDLGEDGKTLWSSGPIRSLRPITRAIIEAWDGWSTFRDNWQPTGNQTFVSVGVQHILLPEPIRYLTDRLVSANIAIPPVDTVVRISSEELLPGLERTYPLDVFSISFVPVALRSFIHHFFPAYVDAFVDYAAQDEKGPKQSSVKQKGKRKDGKLGTTAAKSTEVANEQTGEESVTYEASSQRRNGEVEENEKVDNNSIKTPGLEWAEASALWIRGSNKILGGKEGKVLREDTTGQE